jgi:phage shock protein E
MQSSLLLATILLAMAAPAIARDTDPVPNPQIDYAGFGALTRDVRELRAKRLLPFDRFRAIAATREALLLDARSSNAFARGHLAGAINLPLTDFTAEALAAAIGPNRDRPILIYCNNNFSNHRPPVPLKSAKLALNIQTFINLVGYGYANVWELNDVVDFDDPKTGWVTSPA